MASRSTKKVRQRRALALMTTAVAATTGLAACSSAGASKSSTPTSAAGGGVQAPAIAGSHSSAGALPPAPSQASSGAPAPTVSATGAGVALGIFAKFNGTDYSAVSRLIGEVGHTPSIIQGFYGWKNSNGTPIPFPLAFVKYVAGLGSMPMITWQPGQASTNGQLNGQVGNGQTDPARLDQPDFSLSALAGGSQDSYIQSWAEAAKAYGGPVYVRLMHEMNDHSYPWALGVNGNTTPDQYVAAWRHIVTIFRQAGAGNVQFVWCVGANPPNSPLQALYPGDDWVQWASIDGYNRLKNQPGWETVADIFSRPYQEITSFSDRPVMIAETASVEDPGNSQAKAQWISDGFLNLIPHDFPRVKAVLYFDSTGRGFSYPLSSSPQALAAFRQVATNPEYDFSAPATPFHF